MKAMGHDTFHALEIDALYDELDADGSSAIREHAASCESCAARLERMRRTRQRGLSVLAESVPRDFESRIMAAVDAALAKRAGGPVLVPRLQSVSAAPPGNLGGSAKVIPFFARPSFAVAATMILVLGAAAILSQMGLKRAAPVASSSDDQSSVVAAASAGQAAPTAASDPSLQEAKPAVVAAATAPTEDPPSDVTKSRGKTPESEQNLLALGEAPAARRAPSPATPPPPAMAAQGKAARPSSASGGATSDSSDPAFASALALYNAGRYAEALPRFEAIKANNPEAELFAARCIQRSAKGCAAAAPRFDAIAQRYKGSSVGSRAQLEAGKCYQQMNNVQAARSRYQAAKDEGQFAAEAAQDLDALEAKGAQAGPAATTSPGTPGGSKASPKKPAPPPDVQPTESH